MNTRQRRAAAPPTKAEHTPPAEQKSLGPSTEEEAEEQGYLGIIDLNEGMSNNWMDVAKATGIQDAAVDRQWGARTEMEECTPKPRPGFIQQWVQIKKDDGSPDGAQKMHVWRLGFRPRDPKTLLPGEVAPIYSAGSSGKSLIALNGELVLFEIPEEKYQQLLQAEFQRTNMIYKHIRDESHTGNRNVAIIPSSAASAENLID